MALPLDTRGQNYGDCAEAHKKISGLTLRSTAVEDAGGSACAIGVVREQQLLLLPLDYTLQLRPDMSYLNAESAKQRKDGEESEEDETAEEPMTAVEVTVKRRETERQQQARLNSYSHLQQEEQAEAWVPLQLHAPDSVPADAIWHKLLSEGDAGAAAAAAAAGGSSSSTVVRPMPPSLSRGEYLRSFVPSCAPPVGDALGGSSAAAGAAGAGGGSSSAGGSSAAAAAAGALGDAANAELSQAMGPVMQALAQRHPVCSMANVRQWLQQQGDAQPLAKQAAQLSDALLDALVQATGHVLHIRRMYVAKSGTNAATEGMRKVRLLHTSGVAMVAGCCDAEGSAPCSAACVARACQCSGGTSTQRLRGHVWSSAQVQLSAGWWPLACSCGLLW
ncbi:Sin-like protein conserved region-domain-containing protein [Scenedesmus sp. NREL 46B-D3]|nr:Sin-like protein conserved region-domain-containing protein [Scenedesmus sp. NREL 46B-D3]